MTRLTLGAYFVVENFAGREANLGVKVHAHMLRHACGYKLANDGIDTQSLQAYLGHRNIENTSGTPNCRRGASRISGRIECRWDETIRSTPAEALGPDRPRLGVGR